MSMSSSALEKNPGSSVYSLIALLLPRVLGPWVHIGSWKLWIRLRRNVHQAEE
jgi:hypothetical protein